jgi:hypothetical protein
MKKYLFSPIDCIMAFSNGKFSRKKYSKKFKIELKPLAFEMKCKRIIHPDILL